MKNSTKILLALSSVGVLACETRLEELSTPPPGAIAYIDEPVEEIAISHGAALAFECLYQNRPCVDAELSVESPEVAMVREVFADDLFERTSTVPYDTTETRSIFAIVGRNVGTTTLHVRHDDAEVEYELTVVALRQGSR